MLTIASAPHTPHLPLKVINVERPGISAYLTCGRDGAIKFWNKGTFAHYRTIRHLDTMKAAYEIIITVNGWKERAPFGVICMLLFVLVFMFLWPLPHPVGMYSPTENSCDAFCLLPLIFSPNTIRVRGCYCCVEVVRSSIPRFKRGKPRLNTGEKEDCVVGTT